MSRIIYCSDLILRVDDPDEDLGNITQWILDSTEYRPAFPENCVLRPEVGALGKLSVILVVWMALVVLTMFYCYFCEQRLFPKQRLLDWGGGGGGGWHGRRRGRFFGRNRDWSGSGSSSFLSSWISPSIKRSRGRLSAASPSASSSSMDLGGSFSTDLYDGGGGVGMGRGELKFREFRRLKDDVSPRYYSSLPRHPPPLPSKR